jgi:hypothetical protein
VVTVPPIIRQWINTGLNIIVHLRQSKTGKLSVLPAIYVVILAILPLVPIAAAPPPQNPVVPVMVPVP